MVFPAEVFLPFDHAMNFTSSVVELVRQRRSRRKYLEKPLAEEARRSQRSKSYGKGTLPFTVLQLADLQRVDLGLRCATSNLPPAPVAGITRTLGDIMTPGPEWLTRYTFEPIF